MMRFQAILFLAAVVSTPGVALEQGGAFGACILEDPSGQPINVGSCELKPAICKAEGDCQKVFHWKADDFETVITGGGPHTVRDGRSMNGQEAYAPAALVQGDPRDCIYNAVTDGVFCFIDDPEGKAHLLAADGLDSYGALMQLAGATPKPAGQTGDHTEAGDEMAGLLDALQGKYRPAPTWDCGEVGSDGGATAIEGHVLYGLETACDLSNPKLIGQQGAVLFEASCEGEGMTWEDEYLLRLDQWGSLVVSSLDGAVLWQACE